MSAEWLWGGLLVGTMVFFAVAGTLLVRRWVSAEVLKLNNEVAGFIYAVIGEELGLLGTTTVLACFCIIAWRGVRIAMRAHDAFGSFLALGLTAMIAVQALVNISVVLGLLPTKGIPLPLVSSGGSSLLISLAGIGVLLNVSQHEETS